MSRMREEEVARTLAMVMTERLHPEFMTCREVVATGRYPYTGRLGILSREDEKKVEEAMCAVHAKELGSRDFNAISDGQRQRVLLARALGATQKMLVLDEPVTGLDPKAQLELYELIAQLNRKDGITILMVPTTWKPL